MSEKRVKSTKTAGPAQPPPGVRPSASRRGPAPSL